MTCSEDQMLEDDSIITNQYKLSKLYLKHKKLNNNNKLINMLCIYLDLVVPYILIISNTFSCIIPSKS